MDDKQGRLVLAMPCQDGSAMADPIWPLATPKLIRIARDNAPWGPLRPEKLGSNRRFCLLEGQATRLIT